MSRYSLNDVDWQRVSPLLERRARTGRPPRDARAVLDGVLWILGTGAPWRDLPASFGPWQTVYGRFRRWVDTGALDRVVARLRRALRGRIVRRLWCVDSTVVRASRAAAGARSGQGAQALGRSRGGFGTKLSLVCDAGGVPLAAAVGPGQEHELRRVEPLLAAAIRANGRPRGLAGDKAYSASGLRAWLRRRGVRPVIPTRSDQRRERDFSPAAYRRRNVVERLVGWLKESRRVATRYDKLAESYLAFVQLAIMRRLLRLLGFSDKA